MLQDLDLEGVDRSRRFTALTIALVARSARRRERANHPLDDTYIHTALARNLIERHTRGINPASSRTSTSPCGRC
jgi:hypothetical protein